MGFLAILTFAFVFFALGSAGAQEAPTVDGREYDNVAGAIVGALACSFLLVPDLLLPSLDQFPPPPPVPTKPDPEYNHVTISEERPELIGGLAALLREVQYPEIARKAGVEGRVIIQFIVDENGKVTESAVIRGIGAGCDEEALRVVRQARFKPGKQRGKAVKVKMALPITFKLK